MATDAAKIIQGEVEEVFALQKSLAETEAELMQNEQFRRFLELAKTVPARIDEIWDRVKDQMIEHDVKTVKGDWGSITVAERTSFKVDIEKLPRKFIKRVADTKKIGDTYKLENKLPPGAEPYTTKYLTKRLR